jgi:hypothetical protein
MARRLLDRTGKPLKGRAFLNAITTPKRPAAGRPLAEAIAARPRGKAFLAAVTR